jgi:hypothetical protein
LTPEFLAILSDYDRAPGTPGDALAVKCIVTFVT